MEASSPIRDWLETYANANTRAVFFNGVKHFLACVYGVDAEKPVEEFERLASRYLGECRRGRDWFKDLLKYAVYLHGRPPKTAKAYMGGARGWIEYALEVELSRKQRRLLLGRLPKGSRARTEEAELTREVLRKILTHADAKGRALFLLLASSGMRIGEALQLRLDDVDLNTDPPTVTVRGEYTKSGDKYVTFMTAEAKEALVEWLKIRGDYLKTSRCRGRGLGRIKNLGDPRVFPFSKYVAEQMWRNAIRKAEMAERDKFTNRHKLHIHMLRKFFLSQAKLAVPETVAEAWAGHSGYLDDAYRRYSMEQMRRLYKKAEPYLLVAVPKDIAEIQTTFQNELDKLREQVADLTRKLTDANAINLQLMNENMQLRSRLEDMEQRVKETEGRLANMEKLVKEALEKPNEKQEA